jgi:DNA-binding CsgD family transcriptional regulator
MSDLTEIIINLHGRGHKTIEIAHRLNVAQSTVHYHLRKQAAPASTAHRKPGGRAGLTGATREVIAELLASGLTRAEIATRLGLAKSTVTYHVAKLGGEIDGRFGRRFDWSVVQRYYDERHSVRECAKVFGFSTWSWHAAVRRGAVVPRPKFRPIDEIFATGTRRSRGHLKLRLLRPASRRTAASVAA